MENSKGEKNSVNLKEVYYPVIPLKIFQTWHTKSLPPFMRENVEILKKRHPNFEHFLFDDEDCRNFIEKYFDKEVVDAFDSLIPGAYKADLWRYCVLYIYGGIYLDIKYQVVEGFRLIALTEKEHFVRDKKIADIYGIYNGVMVCKPNNPILLECINEIIKNSRNNFYGLNSLQPTGPQLLSKFIKDKDVDLYPHFFKEKNNNEKNIIVNEKNVYLLESYDQYREEQKIHGNTIHYHYLWEDRKIYKTCSPK